MIGLRKYKLEFYLASVTVETEWSGAVLRWGQEGTGPSVSDQGPQFRLKSFNMKTTAWVDRNGCEGQAH